MFLSNTTNNIDTLYQEMRVMKTLNDA